MNLDTLKVFTSYVAPVLAFVLAMLSTFTEKKKDKEIQNGSQITKIKVLTAYGKTIIILLFIATLVTLSGIIVNKKIEIQDGNKKAKQYSRDSTKAADIYKTAVQTLGTVNSSLSDTKDIQNKAQNMSTELTGQTLQLKKMTTPILPMKIKYTVERTVKIKEGIKYDKSGVSYQNIVDALAKDLGPDSMNGHLLYYGRKNPNHKSVYNISYNYPFSENLTIQKGMIKYHCMFMLRKPPRTI